MEINGTGSMHELLPILVPWNLIVTLVGIATVILTVLVHIVFAAAVYRNANHLDERQALIIVGPKIWCIATLLGGVITAGIYWLMHHSRLNPSVPVGAPETSEK